MNADELLEALRADARTELSRLGSSKAVYALTDGEMSEDAVRAAAAARMDRAARVFDDWAAESEAEAATTFAAVVERARTGHERVGADGDARAAESPMYDVLAGLDGSAERAGGLLGRTLVEDAILGQFVGFFVGRADRSGADLFRGLRDEIAADREAGATLVAAVCDGAEDPDAAWARARTAGVEAIAAAYDDYVARLEAMGVAPKSVC